MKQLWAAVALAAGGCALSPVGSASGASLEAGRDTVAQMLLAVQKRDAALLDAVVEKGASIVFGHMALPIEAPMPPPELRCDEPNITSVAPSKPSWDPNVVAVVVVWNCVPSLVLEFDGVIKIEFLVQDGKVRMGTRI